MKPLEIPKHICPYCGLTLSQLFKGDDRSFLFLSCSPCRKSWSIETKKALSAIEEPYGENL